MGGPAATWSHFLSALFVILSLSQGSLASIGDHHYLYRDCTYTCRVEHSCPDVFSHSNWSTSDCFWCRYDCMWKTVDYFMLTGYDVPQFHGKWPFYSTYLLQEPASAVFSLLNLLTVYSMLRQMKRVRSMQMRRVWEGYCYTGILTWLCSTWFHAKDNFTTERADYFSAFAFVLYAFFAAILFTFPSLRTTKGYVGLSFAFILFYVNHVAGMIEHFNYGYNMTVCIVCSLCTLLTYVAYLYRRWRSWKGRAQGWSDSDRMLILLLICTPATVALELIDMVPIWWVFDSHALFHAATIPLPLITARFLLLHHEESQHVLHTKLV